MSLALFAILLGASGVQSLKQSSDNKKHMAELTRQGAFLPTDEKRYDEIRADLIDNWIYGNKSKYPEEYIDFFIRNDQARMDYEHALTQQQEAREGLKPCILISYDKFTFNPFGRFNNVWLPQIERYNKRVKMQHEEGKSRNEEGEKLANTIKKII